MAMARARMAISHCCNGIRQISVRRFEAGAGQVNHNSTKGSCSSEQPCRFNPFFFHPLNAIPLSLFGLWWYRVSERHKAEKVDEEAEASLTKMFEERKAISERLKAQKVDEEAEASLTKMFEEREAIRERRVAEKVQKEANVRLRKMLEERGVNRESIEARIAEIKQKIESGSASHLERFDLEKHEEWLRLLTRGA